MRVYCESIQQLVRTEGNIPCHCYRPAAAAGGGAEHPRPSAPPPPAPQPTPHWHIEDIADKLGPATSVAYAVALRRAQFDAARHRREYEANTAREDAIVRDEAAALSERVRVCRLRIVDELTLRCPNCSQAFLDYVGCNCLACSRCGQYFCGIDVAFHGTSEEVHMHYRASHGDYFNVPLFHATHLARHTGLIVERVREFGGASVEAKRALVAALALADLRDLGISAEDVLARASVAAPAPAAAARPGGGGAAALLAPPPSQRPPPQGIAQMAPVQRADADEAADWERWLNPLYVAVILGTCVFMRDGRKVLQKSSPLALAIAATAAMSAMAIYPTRRQSTLPSRCLSMATAVIAASAMDRPLLLPQALYLLLQRGLVGDRSNSLFVDAALSLCVPTLALVVVGPASDVATAAFVKGFEDATEAATRRPAVELAAAEVAAAKLRAEVAASEARLLNATGWARFNSGLFWSAASAGVGIATGIAPLFIVPVVWASWVVRDWWRYKPPGSRAKA